MNKKTPSKLKNYFKEIYPFIWEHYRFLYDIRTDNHKFESLLAFESLLTLIFITIFQTHIMTGEIIFLIPLLSFLISIFFSLYTLIPKKIWFPWFEKEDLKKIWELTIKEDKDFYEQGLRDIYGVLLHLWEFNLMRSKVFFNNALTFYISIVLSFIAVLIYNNLNILILLFLPITIIAWMLVQKNWNKEMVKKNPATEVEKFFDKWKEEAENK